jgi:hypothetical protein
LTIMSKRVNMLTSALRRFKNHGVVKPATEAERQSCCLLDNSRNLPVSKKAAAPLERIKTRVFKTRFAVQDSTS